MCIRILISKEILRDNWMVIRVLICYSDLEFFKISTFAGHLLLYKWYNFTTKKIHTNNTELYILSPSCQAKGF